nr:His-Xaa-Ser system radical SAM maturase HxsB [Candidatus Dadabacteria bacterium]
PYGLANINQNELGYDVEDFTSSYNDALDYIIKLNLDGFHFTEYYSTLLMSRILTPFSTGFVDLQSPSGAGICGVIYDYNGDVFPADEARMLARMGDRKFIMGNVHRDNYIDIFDNPMLKELVDKSCVETMPGCASCAFQLYCGADPIRNYVENGDIVGHRPTSEFCKKNLLLIESLFKKIREKDKDVLDVFWSWMTKRSLEDLRCENIQRSSH